LLRYSGYCQNVLTAKGRRVAKQLPNRLVSEQVIRAGENTG
jgi:broad specificity phosphatase PhoE